MRKILLMVCFIYLVTLGYSIPQVYPNILELELRDGVVYSEITVSNNEERAIKYELGVKQDSDEFDLSPYIQFFPKIMEIEPSRQKKVRIAIKNLPYDQIEEGELRALLEIKEIVSDMGKIYRKQKRVENIKTDVNVVFNVAMMVYGRKGLLTESISLSIPKDIGESVVYEIHNTGNVSFKPEVQLVQGGEVLNIRVPKILRGGYRNVKLGKKQLKNSELIISSSSGEELVRRQL